MRECQLSFDGPGGAVSVDLHWTLLPGYFPKTFPEADVWRDLRQMPFCRTTVFALSATHLLLFVCAHGAKHVWERLGWVCDLARLIQMEPDIDWPGAFAQSRAAGTSRMLALGLIFAAEITGVTLPDAAAERIGSVVRARELAQRAHARARAGAPIPVPALESTFFSMLTFERNSQRARYLIGAYLQPSEAEFRALKLPRGLFALYYLFRPMRIAAKYARTLA
jgi:hypothetical protein